MRICNRILLAVAFTMVGLAMAHVPASAGGLVASGVELRLSCENGHEYPIQPRAVAVDGDLVTGYLVLRPRHAVHIRLIPMGAGYRYAGRGVWFDGTRGAALLYLDKHHPIACRVLPGDVTATLAVRN
jgi:hypothetical protein